MTATTEIRVLKSCDVVIEGERKALFDGQVYRLPVDVAESLVKVGHADWASGRRQAKAVSGPPEDKAVKAAEDKSTCTTCGRKFKALGTHKRLTGHE